MATEPSLRLSIPSLADGTALDCRVFHPPNLTSAAGAEGAHEEGGERAKSWRRNRHVAVVAHPYAPLGGDADNPVVEDVAEILLKRGFLVGTFNFRGAGGSGGRTSWTGKAETDDYASFVAFLVHYANLLDPLSEDEDHPEDHHPDETETETSTTSPCGQDHDHPPWLLLAGYSYGSLITRHLPPLRTMLESLSSPAAASPAAQIRLRAESLADQQGTALRGRRRLHARGEGSGVGLRVGGREGMDEEDADGDGEDGGERRKARARGMSELLARTRGAAQHVAGQGGRHRRQRSSSSAVSSPKDKPRGEHHHLPPAEPYSQSLPRPAYLLIAPLIGLVPRLATFNMLPLLIPQSHAAAAAEEAGREARLARGPTLAVWGDSDGFSSAGKLRAWSARMGGGWFRGVEVPTAGHFWVEEGVLGRMLGEVDGFAGELAGGRI